MAKKSIEEQIEDIAKRQLKDTKYYTKTEGINSEIEEALKKAPSKKGSNGGNFPDIKLFIQTAMNRKIPVMIEVKGTKGYLIKIDETGQIENRKKDGSPAISNIDKYAVNGAVHYANAILDYTSSYEECIAVGVNGYNEGAKTFFEVAAFYISKKNSYIPKKIDDYQDMSFLLKENIEVLINKIDSLSLTDEEIELKTKEIENKIEIKLKELNQIMHDQLEISAKYRVGLITGMIMAGFGVEGKVSPLQISDLRGDMGRHSTDGDVVINKIRAFLEEKNIPEEKKTMIINDLTNVFTPASLSKPINGESKIKTIYRFLNYNIMPFFATAGKLDFTGKLFNILNDWVDIPDGAENDVVLTPRYITDVMAKLAQVNMDSYVWDFAVGTAGFLISSMKLMINDAEKNITSPEQLKQKIYSIKEKQLLGIEKLPDIYLLAVLNMFLMQDGSSNIIHGDSLEYSGNYEQGKLKGSKYPANVFLLNPPYSAKGKGFIFVERALEKMQNGKAAILIQENAGSGNGLPYTKNILKKNTLLASIRMADIFRGKAGVQTAIYIFDVGIPHDVRKNVKFIDFSNDGYTRQHRKKANADVNLRNTDHAHERYEELVNLVLYGKEYLNYFTEKEYIEDKISLEGNDWTFSQHKKIETRPTEEDFRRVIQDYYSWKISIIVKEK